MFKKENSNKRLLLLSSLIIVLVFVYICQTWLLPTLTRYIHREQDEIRAYYTALYFDSTGEGKTIALEDSVGYVEFDLRNYVEEKVTQRDIVYSISKPSVFYDELGNEIANDEIETYLADPNKHLHVLDVWGKPQRVARSTYLYDVEVIINNGEVVSEGVYTFTYEKLGTSAVGKVHNVTCKVTREDGAEPLEDTISLVVQLSKPYKEVLIINMNVSNRLITFAHKEVEMFDVMFDKIYVQTSDLFAYHKDQDNTIRKAEIDANSYYQFTPYAFKLTISWNGYVLDEDKLEDIHIGTSPFPGGDKLDDKVDSNGMINNNGTTPNPDILLPYLDVKKSTIAKINSLYDNVNGHTGELVIFIPQGSDLYFNFLKTASQGSIDVKIEAYVSYVVNGEIIQSRYVLYTEDILSGYEHTNNLYNLATYSK